MLDRRALIYGLRIFAIIFGAAATAGYLNRNPAAPPSDLAKGMAVSAAICAVLAFVAAIAWKHIRDDADG